MDDSLGTYSSFIECNCLCYGNPRQCLTYKTKMYLESFLKCILTIAFVSVAMVA